MSCTLSVLGVLGRCGRPVSRSQCCCGGPEVALSLPSPSDSLSVILREQAAVSRARPDRGLPAPPRPAPTGGGRSAVKPPSHRRAAPLSAAGVAVMPVPCGAALRSARRGGRAPRASRPHRSGTGCAVPAAPRPGRCWPRPACGRGRRAPLSPEDRSLPRPAFPWPGRCRHRRNGVRSRRVRLSPPCPGRGRSGAGRPPAARPGMREGPARVGACRCPVRRPCRDPLSAAAASRPPAPRTDLGAATAWPPRPEPLRSAPPPPQGPAAAPLRAARPVHSLSGSTPRGAADPRPFYSVRTNRCREGAWPHRLSEGWATWRQ